MSPPPPEVFLPTKWVKNLINNICILRLASQGLTK